MVSIHDASAKVCRLRYFLLPLLTLSLTVAAQTNPNLDNGIHAFGSYDSSSISSVNLQNGALSVKIPLFSYPQRGSVQAAYYLVLGSKAWTITQHCNTNLETCTGQWGLTTGGTLPAVGPTLVLDTGIPAQHTTQYKPSGGATVYVYSAIDADGSQHQMAATGTTDTRAIDGSGLYCLGCQHGSQISPFFYTRNGDRAGTIFNSNNLAVPVYEDANGNYSTVSTPSIDTLDRSNVYDPATSTSDSTGCTGGLAFTSSTVESFPGVNGGTRKVKLCYATLALTTSFHVQFYDAYQTQDLAAERTNSPQNVLQSALLYNGSSWTTSPAWTFEYNNGQNGTDTGGSPIINYGDLTKITLPTGGTISYAWDTRTGGSCTANSLTPVSRGVIQRTVDANDDSPAQITSYNGGTVTDGAGNDTVHTFTSSSGGCNPYETATKYYSGTGTTRTLLKTVTTNYRSQFLQEGITNGEISLDVDVLPIRVTTTWPTGLVSKVETDYDSSIPVSGLGSAIATVSYGTITQRREYALGSGAPGAVIRCTAYTYKALQTSSYLSANLLNLPSSQTIYNGACPSSGGSPAAQTTFAYDEYGLQSSAIIDTLDGSTGTVRGNLTSVTKLLNPGASTVVTHTHYFDTGMPYQLVDANSKTTTLAYSSAYHGAYATHTTMPVTGTVQHIVSSTYDLNSGLTASSTDQNQNATSYTYDSLMRPLVTQRPDGGTTTNSYPDLNHIDTTVTQSPDPSKLSVVVVDGLGRVKQTQLTSDPAGAVSVDTAYDAAGRVQGVTNPYRSMSDATYGSTTYTYDGLGRMLRKIDPDSSYQQWSYIGNTVTFSDENFNQWKRTYDALGRLTQVLEPSGAVQAPTLETDYTYDVLDNLTNVTQHGASGETAVVRNFQYDTLSRLTYASNPESGAVCYGKVVSGACQKNGYDSNGNLIYKTDALGVLTTNAYDALNRLTSETYSDAITPTKTFIYDETGGTNTTGQLTREYASIGGQYVAYRTMGSYDAMGRLRSEQKCSLFNCGATNYTFNYSYDQGGNLTGSTSNNGLASTDASTIIQITYGYDSAGHVKQVTSGYNDSTSHPATLFLADSTVSSSPAYSPFGTLANAKLSIFTGQSVPNISLNRSYDKRGRALTATYTKVGGPVLYSFNLSGSAGGYDSVGNVAGSTESVMGQWTYTYDSLNRLTKATAGTGANLNGVSIPAGKLQAWKYDSFGNRLNQTASTGTVLPTHQATYTAATNRIAGSDTAAVIGVDVDGRLLSDGNKNYGWEAQGLPCSVTVAPGGTGTAYYQYVYDAEGNLITTVARNSAGCDLNYQALWEDFVRDKDGNQITEISGAGSWKHTNVYANGALLATYDPQGVHFAFSDWEGTKRVQVTATGTVDLSCWNLPYNDASHCSTNDATELRYVGKEHDPFTGLDLFGARDLTNYSGRFLSPDPSVLLYADPTNPQTLNLYSYGLNNPLTNSDPSGLSCITLTHDGGTSEQGDDGDGQGCAAAGIAGDGTVDTNRRDSVSVNGNNGSSQPLSSTLQTAGYLLAWVNGAGAFVPTIDYGPNTLGTKDMRNTGTVKRAIQAYKDAGCPAAGGKLNSGSGFNGHFGPWQETRDDMLTGMPNPTQAEVGGYTGSIVNNGDGTDTMSIDNTTGLASLTGVSTYAPGATKAVDTAGSLMGMPPMKQHFHWTQQDPCHN